MKMGILFLACLFLTKKDAEIRLFMCLTMKLILNNDGNKLVISARGTIGRLIG